MQVFYPNRRSGLTLLEIMVAIGILSTLLVVLWRLVNVYTSLREKGEAHVERVADVAVLMQQLEQDLRSLPQNRTSQEPLATADPDPNSASRNESSCCDSQAPLDPPAPDPSLAVESEPTDLPERTFSEPTIAQDPHPMDAELASSQPELERTQMDTTFLDDHTMPSGLVGDERSLTLAQIDRDMPRQVARGADRESYEPQANERTIERKNGLDSGSAGSEALRMPIRMVRYWLVGAVPAGIAVAIPSHWDADPDSEDLEDPDPTSRDEATGFFREEYVSSNGLANRSSGLETDRTAEESGDSDLLIEVDGDESAESEPSQRRSYHLSQVEWAAFRYFDGSTWRTTWDSRISGQLPVAVEMNLWLARSSGEKQKTDTAHHRDRLADHGVTQWGSPERSSEESFRAGQPRVDGVEESIVPEESLNSLYADDGTVRLPEIRQLVVLRSAVPQRSVLPALEPAPPRLIPPRHAPHPARAYP